MTTTCTPIPRSRRGLVLAWLVVAVAPALLAGSVLGASPPAPAASPMTPESLGLIQAWLDSESITPDAPAGGVVQVGVTFWDTGQLALAPVHGVYVRLRPAKGNAAPSEAKVEADFPGHVLATVTVPKGGPGTVVVGVHGQSCDASGTCTPVDIPMRFAGTGPPPGAKVFDLVGASIHDIVGDVVVGRPLPLTVDVMPRGLWDVSAVGLADQVDVVATGPGGTEIGTGALTRQGDVGTPYSGTVTLRATGSASLAVAIPVGGVDLVVAGEPKVVTVIEPGARPSDAPAGAAATAATTPQPTVPAPDSPADGGIPPFVWVLGIAVAVVGGGFLLLRFLADQ